MDAPHLDGGGILLAKPGKEWRLEFVHRTLLHEGLEVGQRDQQAFDVERETADGTVFLIPVYPGSVKSVAKTCKHACKC